MELLRALPLAYRYSCTSTVQDECVASSQETTSHRAQTNLKKENICALSALWSLDIGKAREPWRVGALSLYTSTGSCARVHASITCALRARRIYYIYSADVLASWHAVVGGASRQ